MSGTSQPIPVLCNPQALSPDERCAQVLRALEALVGSPQGRETLPDGLRFHYARDEAHFLRLAEYAANEHRCCAWVTFRLEMDAAPQGNPVPIRLTLTVPPEGMAALAEGLAVLESAAKDAKALQRLQAWFAGQEGPVDPSLPDAAPLAERSR